MNMVIPQLGPSRQKNKSDNTAWTVYCCKQMCYENRAKIWNMRKFERLLVSGDFWLRCKFANGILSKLLTNSQFS